MSSQLKISADTSQVKKSILDIGKTLKDLKGSKVTIFSSDERKFLKSELKKEIALVKSKLKENRDEIKKYVEAQKGVVKGSKEELEVRKQIVEAYKVQAKLGRDLASMQKSHKSVDSSGGGIMGSLMGMARMIPGMAAIATVGYGLVKGKQASDQYRAGVGSRNQLAGLGVSDQSFGSPSELARVGLTEQDMIQRRVEATARLGRNAGSQENEMRRASFERAFGLDGGTMTGIANQLRGSFGGDGANEAQMKLQASVFAAGIEDAIGPYLESATQLLSAINENGTTQTDEITNLLAQLTKDGERTPELIAKTFMGINDSVKGATGESSAFLQAAFARAGIGGGTLGGTKFALSSGGIMGQDRKSLERRGYNKQLLDQMEKSGMFAGAGQRTSAILDMVRSSGGLKPGESVSSITDTDRMVGLGNLANNIFGTKGDQGFDALMMLEKVQNKQMTQRQFDAKIQEMKEGKDPAVSRLDKINSTLAGQTEILQNINTSLMEALGKETAQMTNQLTRMDNEGIVGIKNVSGAVNDSGTTKGIGDVGTAAGKAMNSGGLGGAFYELSIGGIRDLKTRRMMSDESIINHAKKRRDEGTGFRGMTDEQIEKKVRDSLSKQRQDLTAKDIGKEVANALKESPIINKTSTKVQLPSGQVIDRTNK